MRFQRTAIIPTALAAGLVMLAAAYADTSQEAAFQAENQAAMDKMMAGMDIKPTGIDHDFTAMMIPHRLGAVDMAQAELRYGHNEQLRRIAGGPELSAWLPKHPDGAFSPKLVAMLPRSSESCSQPFDIMVGATGIEPMTPTVSR